ncbi:hypothetical protein DPMN_096354 [Dreissena polymorpha]|uniref:Uncharacterized protein n=1 Tax=Dreissena polymorpha TaxID=45954 RepID=A0A9D4L9Q9_DREPO|nr:hypothetical protein DPMN_096354 [Dreissena polymorpha]
MTERLFPCKIKSALAFLFTDGAQARAFCPNTWVVYEDSCYLFADETNVAWPEAVVRYNTCDCGL